MDAIADKGHSALTWLLGLGLIAAWAALDEPPPVIDTAYGIVLRTIGRSESPLFEIDPLKTLPPGYQTQLAQVRHECFRYQGGFYQGAYQECCAALEPVEVEAVLALGREVLKQTEQSETTKSKWFLTIEALRRDLARLESWHHKGGLSSASSLLDLQSQLDSRIQVPGTEQSLDVPHCLIFIGLGIAALQLYLLSLLSTMAELAPGDTTSARSWVVLHRRPIGPVLATLWIWLPGIAWLAAAVLVPLGRLGGHPTALDWTIAALIGATLVPMPRLMAKARNRHLVEPSTPTTPTTTTSLVDAPRLAA